MLCDIRLPAVCVACGGTPPRALWQFGNMISCLQPHLNPLVYNNYGCYCGFSGSGSPKDQIDQYVLHSPSVTIATNITPTSLFVASSGYVFVALKLRGYVQLFAQLQQLRTNQSLTGKLLDVQHEGPMNL